MTSNPPTTTGPTPPPSTGEMVSRLLHTLGDPDPARGAEDITVVGADPLVPSVHRLADAMSAAIGVFGRQTAALGEQRGHPHQRVRVRAGAAIDQLMATYHTTLSGRPLGALLDDPTLLGNNDFYRARDGRWIFIITTYPHLRDAVHSVLRCGLDKVGIARAAAGWDAFTLEEAVCARGGVACVVRTRHEWLAHPAGRYVARRPVVEIERVGDGPVRPLEPVGEAEEALAGVRVLDLTHVIAGPVAARLLAQFGADVLHLSRPDRPDPIPMIAMTGGGKRNAYCDLRDDHDRAAFHDTLQDADVFVHAYRGLARHGASTEELVRRRPGLITLEYHAWGADGPWGERGGFDQLACSATGFAVDEWTDRPSLPPTYLLNDYLAAYLGAAAVATVLRRRATEGGSWRIRVTLAGVCHWVQELGLLARESVRDLPRPGRAPLAALSTTDTDFGPLTEPATPFAYSGRPVPQPGRRSPLGSAALRWR
ncbi:CoA transferase [Kitasatospora xanthocidica]|uniref:CoA transferase n=1 Tax=Kitasatospora xanthocidica TaxID=83382 RepID=UPI001675526E|nr:CoA transferase [Kitasatospora xanthocidica]GHF76487.1 CoA transferase [Kitasatospora xanthocidica]